VVRDKKMMRRLDLVYCATENGSDHVRKNDAVVKP